MAGGARYHFHLRPVDDEDADPVEVIAKLRDVSLWERTIRGRSLGAIERDGQLNQLEEICHFAAKRMGIVDCNLAQFRERYDIEPIAPPQPTGEEGDGDEDPTRSGR